MKSSHVNRPFSLDELADLFASYGKKKVTFTISRALNKTGSEVKKAIAKAIPAPPLRGALGMYVARPSQTFIRIRFRSTVEVNVPTKNRGNIKSGGKVAGTFMATSFYRSRRGPKHIPLTARKVWSDDGESRTIAMQKTTSSLSLGVYQVKKDGKMSQLFYLSPLPPDMKPIADAVVSRSFGGHFAQSFQKDFI